MVLEIDQVFNFPASIHQGLSTKHTTTAPIYSYQIYVTITAEEWEKPSEGSAI